MNKETAMALNCLSNRGKNPYKSDAYCFDMAKKHAVIKKSAKIAKKNIDADAEIAMMILAGLEQPAESDVHKLAAELLKQYTGK